MSYKLLSDSDTKYSEKWFAKIATSRQTRHSNALNNLVICRAKHSYRWEFFSLRVPEKWNNLPDTVKEASTVSMFKNRLRNIHNERVARRTP
jgi:hypothetical protein